MPAPPACTLPQGHARRSLPLLGLAGCGAGLLLLNLALVLRWPLFTYFPGPGVPVGLVELIGPQWQAGVRWYVGVVSLQFLLYAGALVAAYRVPLDAGRWLAWSFPVGFALVLLFMYPATAVDLIHYLAAARVFAVWGDNPLVTPHGAHPFAVGLNYPNDPSPYGPLWSLLTLPAGLLSRIDIRLGLLALKVLAAGSYLGCIWMIERTLRRMVSERGVLLGVVAFAWNPLVVFRVVGNGHNSLVMMFFVLLAAYWLVTERWDWVLPALAAGIWVKYIPVLLIPPLVVYLIALCRARGTWAPLASTAGGVVTATTITLAVWLPFLSGIEASILAELQDMYTSTPGVLAYQLGVWGISGAETLARRALLAVWAALSLGLMALLWWTMRRDERTSQGTMHLMAVWFLVFFGFLVIAAPVMRPWYFIWFVSLGALLPGRGYLLVIAIASYTATLAEVVEQYFTVLPWVRESYGRQVIAPVAIQSLPATIVLVVLAIRTRSLLLTGSGRTATTRAQPAPIRGESVSQVAEAR